jgi:hypothetical protein
LLAEGTHQAASFDRKFVAACAGHRLKGEKGTWKREKGDLTAILAIIDRLEGRAPQKISVDSESRLEVKLTTVEQVRTFLLERGIDVARVPPPPMLTAR